MTFKLSSKQRKLVGRVLRYGVVVVYLAWGGAGFFILRARQVPPSDLRYEAARVLPAGSRLHAEDVRYGPHVRPRDRHDLPPQADLIGKYVRYHRMPGDPIRLDHLTTVPFVKVAPGTLAYSFALQDQHDLADVLNTGSRVSLYAANTTPVENVLVVSVVCATAPSPKCSAVLELSKSQVSTITAHKDSNYRLVLQDHALAIEGDYRVVHDDSNR